MNWRATIAAFVAGLVAGGAVIYLAMDRAALKGKAEAAQAQVKAVQVARADEKKAQDRLQGIAEDAQKQRNAALGDAFAATAAVDGLRRAIAETASRGAASNSAVANGSKAAGNPSDLLADVLRESLSENEGLARYADESRIAGAACEASYNAVRNTYSAEQ